MIIQQSCKSTDLVFKKQDVEFENVKSYNNAELNVDIIVIKDSLIITNFKDLNIYLIKNIALNKIGTYYYSDSLVSFIDTSYGNNPTAAVIDKISIMRLKPIGYTYHFDSLDWVTHFNLKEVDTFDLKSNLNLIWKTNKYIHLQDTLSIPIRK
jgi:hypothetical protein